MSDDADKPAEAAPKKSKMGLIIGLVIAAITLVGGSVAGAVLGPKLLGSSEVHAAPAKAGPHEIKGGHGDPALPEKIVSVDVAPIIVDLRDGDSRIRHLKVGMTVELSETTTPEEFKLFVPRGREACLTYLRSLSFEDVSDPKRYVEIKDEISKRVSVAVGEARVHRILLVDFVLQ